MKVKIKGDEWVKEVDIEKGMKVRDILIKAGINPETVIVKRDGEIALDDEPVYDDFTLEVVSVVSGG